MRYTRTRIPGGARKLTYTLLVLAAASFAAPLMAADDSDGDGIDDLADLDDDNDGILDVN